MKKNIETPAHVGSASILLIFTVLSLISFATLTTVNARADYNLSKNLSARQEAYYRACHRGSAFIAAVNSGYTTGEENGIIKKNIPITDNQSLDITLTADSAHTVTQWQIVNYEDSGYDYTLPVYGSN